MRNALKGLLILVLAGSFLACSNKPTAPNYGRGYTYRQEIKTPVALFIRERNGVPTVLASAFLIDKQRGLLASAKHFVGTDADGECKIFFNGRVYNGTLVRVPPTTDIAVIKIIDRFNQANFTEPYPMAGEIEKDDKVFVKGIHPHHPKLRSDKVIIPIFQEYYQMIWRNPNRVYLISEGDEFVYDDLPAKVMNLTKELKNKNMGIKIESIAEISNTYIELKTDEDHKFSFGGLSGGPTINERGELIGINSNEIQAHWEIDPERRKATYHPWNNMNIVPVAELQKLLPHLANIR